MLLLGPPQGVEDGNEGASGDVDFYRAVVLGVDVDGQVEVFAVPCLSDEERPVVAVAHELGVGDAGSAAQGLVVLVAIRGSAGRGGDRGYGRGLPEVGELMAEVFHFPVEAAGVLLGANGRAGSMVDRVDELLAEGLDALVDGGESVIDLC